MRGHRLVSGLLVASLALLGASSAGASGAAATFTVAGFGDGSGTAACTPPDASGNSVCPTLRAAVNAASKQANSPTIELQAGTYQLTLGNGGQLDLATSINLVGVGPGGPTGTTIQQTDGQNRVLEVDGTTKLSGLEITGGHLAPAWSSGVTDEGGGILVVGTLALQDASVTGNEVDGAAGPSTGNAGDNAEGGGIAYGASATAGSVISDSTIHGNQAVAGAGGNNAVGGIGEGGGIAYEGTGPLTVQSSTIDGNSATGGAGGPHTGGGARGGAAEGGGIFNSGNLEVIASTITANTARGGAQGVPASPSSFGGPAGGGGIFSQEGADTLMNTTVFQNAVQGGVAAQAGTAGSVEGGGVLAEGSAGGLTLQSDTFDANQGQDLYVNVGTSAPYPFTVHDTVVAVESPDNCDIQTPPSSEAYNLEDDPADTCGFTAANHDLVGVTPDLASALANNGGPTQTLAPAPASPVLGAGGQCLDPTSTPPNQPLTVDQRGEPRSTPCDIGAFQAQRPGNTELPTISGTAGRGHRLICSQGAWTGDGLLQYAFAWLRNGNPIPGATTNSYLIGTGDPGRSLACRVTATYYGSVAATSEFVTVPSYPLITLLRARVHGATVVVDLGCRGPGGERCGGRMHLSVVEKRRGSRVVAVMASPATSTVTVAQRRYSLRTRHTASITISLKAPGTRLLKRFGSLPVMLTVRQTTAERTATVASRKLKLHPARPARPHT